MERIPLTKVAKIKKLAAENKTFAEIAREVGCSYAVVRYHAMQAQDFQKPSHAKTIQRRDEKMLKILNAVGEEGITKKELADKLGINPTALSVWLKESESEEVQHYSANENRNIWKVIRTALLYYGGGYSYSRIASIQHISNSTVQNRLKKVRDLHLEDKIFEKILLSDDTWQELERACKTFKESKKDAQATGELAKVVSLAIKNPRWDATKRAYSNNKLIVSLMESVERFGGGRWTTLVHNISDLSREIHTAKPSLRNMHKENSKIGAFDD